MRISLEEFSNVIETINSAATSPDRWKEALSAVARLVDEPVAAHPTGQEENGGPRAYLAGIDRRLSLASEPSLQRLMGLLEAHMKTARRIQGRLSNMVTGELALAGLDRLAAAALILNRSGLVQHRNRSARELLTERCCIRMMGSKLSFKDPKLNRPFASALHAATQAQPRSSILPVPSGNEVFELTVSPLAGENVLVAERLALVALARPVADAKRIVRRVRLLYGLTEAEARVVAALALGATVDEVTREHGVRITTIRAQLHSIFQKTGTSRQSDLVRLALSTPMIVVTHDG